MWRPGFPFLERRPARLADHRRAFCIYSHHHRGTAERPGLVLGLANAPGRSCRGIAFRVAADRAAETRDYLDERELIGYAYKAVMLDVTIEEDGAVPAYTFVGDPEHRQYAGELPLDRQAELIMEAEGIAGLNRDYLINTIREFEAEGFVEPELHALLERVEELTGIIEAGGGI
jgi:cation transport protein ChaC